MRISDLVRSKKVHYAIFLPWFAIFTILVGMKLFGLNQPSILLAAWLILLGVLTARNAIQYLWKPTTN